MIQSLANFLRRRQQSWNSGQMLSILAHSSLEVHCSYRLKFFVAKNHLRSSSPSNCSLLCSRFARSCSPRPSQRSKYTEGVVLRMRICIAVQKLSRKCVQKKKIRPPRFRVSFDKQLRHRTYDTKIGRSMPPPQTHALLACQPSRNSTTLRLGCPYWVHAAICIL